MGTDAQFIASVIWIMNGLVGFTLAHKGPVPTTGPSADNFALKLACSIMGAICLTSGIIGLFFYSPAMCMLTLTLILVLAKRAGLDDEDDF